MTAAELAQKAQDGRGYLVVCHDRPMQVGQVYPVIGDGRRIDPQWPKDEFGPVVCVSETNERDMDEQYLFLGMRPVPPTMSGLRYYRVVAE